MAIKTDAQLTTDNNEVATKYDDRFSFTQFLKTFLKDLIDSKEQKLPTSAFNGYVLIGNTDGTKAFVATPQPLFTTNLIVNLGGGRTAGRYLNGQTIVRIGKTQQEVMDDMYVEYINPVFTSFGLNQALQVEVGTILTGTRDFTWAITPNNGVVPTINIFDVTGNLLLLNTPNDGSETGVTITTIQLNTPNATQSWLLIASNISPAGSVNSQTITTTAYYNIFQGAASTLPNNSATVRALPITQFYTGAGNLIINTGSSFSKFVVALPPTASIVSVFDLDASNVNLTANYINTGNITVQDIGGTNRTYSLWTMSQAIAYTTNHRHSVNFS